MGSWQHVLADAFAWAITLFVPAMVWGLLAAGLYQLVRDRIRDLSRGRVRLRHDRVAPTAARPLAEKPAG
jgi:hypothetical protein